MPSKMSSRPLKAPRLLGTLSPGPEPRIPGIRRLEPVVPAISITPSLAGSRVKRREATRAVPNYALDVQCGNPGWSGKVRHARIQPGQGCLPEAFAADRGTGPWP